ncbi:histone-lysine N-methyltransferase ASHR2 [Physcomitrium patens]|uniref:SET domain-containing protein n=1 Tax=Physcomitrium patens TaxID=3218 RepID=A0A2K1JD02_PHYPA|nr:histone-lysine N-methyltransferase ASHR2-like [Physcomitrium patens]PNR39402.1 hypothetical protein PHYPA_019680 [Physcomitrium patens]|eukprot:XP_024397521.1 histone-lysine N-methyltransferase ASHR2-like [Physcomitrella patens]
MALRQEVIAGRGRGMVATRMLRAGAVLLRESPLLLYQEAESAESTAFCSNCMRVLSLPGREKVPCSACDGATFCGKSCFESARVGSHNTRVCSGIAMLQKSKDKFSLEHRTLARFLIAAYNLAVEDPLAFAKLLELEGQECDEEVVKSLHDFVVEIFGKLDGGASLELSLELTGKLLARDACNTFGLMAPSCAGEERKVRGYAMFAQASMFNHDCLPNACRFEYVDIDGDGNTDVIVRALHDMEEGTEVCLSYFPVDWPYGDRQQKLQEEYGFWCTCARCNVESKWKDEDEEQDEEDEGYSNGELELGKGEATLEDVESIDDDDDDEDDFGHAMFFVKYLCPVEGCGGTMAPLPPGELDHQGLEGSMECNFCGCVRSDEEFHRDLEEHAVDDD